jgi:hypothetical protein
MGRREVYTGKHEGKETTCSGVPRGVWGVQLGAPPAVQQIQLRTEGRENGDLGAVAP